MLGSLQIRLNIEIKFWCEISESKDFLKLSVNLNYLLESRIKNSFFYELYSSRGLVNKYFVIFWQCLLSYAVELVDYGLNVFIRGLRLLFLDKSSLRNSVKSLKPFFHVLWTLLIGKPAIKSCWRDVFKFKYFSASMKEVSSSFCMYCNLSL